MWIGIFAALASVFAVLYAISRRKFRSGPLLVSTAAWALAALYEWWFQHIYDPAHKFDIRADFVFVLALCVVIGLLAGAISLRRR